MRPVEIDPWTEKAVSDRVTANFEEVAREIVEDCGEDTLEAMHWSDVAVLFFANGYLNGAVDAATEEDFMDDARLISDEIKYQKDNGF